MEAHQLCPETNLDCWSYPYETNSFELINLEMFHEAPTPVHTFADVIC